MSVRVGMRCLWCRLMCLLRGLGLTWNRMCRILLMIRLVLSIGRRRLLSSIGAAF